MDFGGGRNNATCEHPPEGPLPIYRASLVHNTTKPASCFRNTELVTPGNISYVPKRTQKTVWQRLHEVLDTANSPALSSITEVSLLNMWQWPVSIHVSANHSSDIGWGLLYLSELSVFAFSRMVVFRLWAMDHGSLIFTEGVFKNVGKVTPGAPQSETKPWALKKTREKSISPQHETNWMDIRFHILIMFTLNTDLTSFQSVSVS